MASAKTLMKRMDLSSGIHGVGGLVLDGGVGFGASYGLARLYQRHHDKWYGKNAPRIAAIVGKAGAIIASAFTGGHPGLIVGGINSVGQAGINAIGLEMGLRHERERQGLVAVLAPKGSDLKKIAGASEMTSMGALGKAGRGRGLSWDQVEELARGR